MFRTIPVVDTVWPAGELPSPAAAYPLDSITLGWEERMKTRARRRSDGGVEFAVALARGTVLHAGDRLVLDRLPLVIVIHERAEPVLVVHPARHDEWALWCYHIGNSHQPLMIADDGLICPDIPGVELMLAYHAIPFARELRAFTPVSQLPSHAHRVQP